MRIMKQLSSCLLLILVSKLAFSVELILTEVGDDQYALTVFNNSNIDVNIANQVCISLLGNFSFIIKDSSGSEHSVAVRLNEKCNIGSSLLLEPYRFIGRRFHIEEFKSYYQLETGVYDINALMCDLPNVDNGNKTCFSSNTIKLNIRE